MRSTGKCDIMFPLDKGIYFMKTKIIYISGDEFFDIRDICAAFEEVRTALNLDKNTVLFGVPVDSEDAGFATKTEESVKTNEIPEIIDNIPEQIIPEKETEPEIIPEPISLETETESIDAEQPVKKRGRPRKENIDDTTVETVSEQTDSLDEKVVPILSVLSTKEEIIDDNAEIIPEISDEIIENPTDENNEMIKSDDDDADLEKLLSEMTPLDVSEDKETENIIEPQPVQETNDLSVDLTLEQLATEFAENQDKIKSETKNSARNRIGKLRNILPFKQSKHKDTGLGDLFGWAGIAANDEEFSVPGFFTNAASRK